MRVLEPFMWILWDLLAVLIFVRCVYLCANRGFVSTIVSFLVYFVGVFIAFHAYKYIADFLYDNVVYDAVRSILTRNLNLVLDSIGEGDKNIMSSIPFILRLLMGNRSGMVESLPVASAETMSAEIVEIALKDPLVSALHAVGYMLAFSLATFFMRYLSRLFTGINRIPIIGAVNTVLGGVVGVLEGLISLLVSAFILRLLITFSGDAWWWLNTDIMNGTYIWRLFY